MFLKSSGHAYQKELGQTRFQPNVCVGQQLVNGDAAPAVSHHAPAEDTARGSSFVSLTPLVSLTSCLPGGWLTALQFLLLYPVGNGEFSCMMSLIGRGSRSAWEKNLPQWPQLHLWGPNALLPFSTGLMEYGFNTLFSHWKKEPRGQLCLIFKTQSS